MAASDSLPHLTLISPSTWEEEFFSWEAREILPITGWEAFYKDRGYNSWAEWRYIYYKAYGLDKAAWTRYEVDPENVAAFFRDLYCTSSPNWRKLLYNKDRAHSKFKDLAFHPHWENPVEQKKLQSMHENFPQDSHFLGIYSPKGDSILVEGNHRAITLVRAAALGEHIHGRITISMAPYEQELFDRIWANSAYMDSMRLLHFFRLKLGQLLGCLYS